MFFGQNTFVFICFLNNFSYLCARIENYVMIQAKEIKRRITSGRRNRLYFTSDFADMKNDGVVARTLSRLATDGLLYRIAQGIYLYPLRNAYGIQKPPLDKIAEAVAGKYHSNIIPSGLTALNRLGFSTQVPMNAVYITDGTPRTINIGARSILFKKGVPRHFAYSSKTFSMLVMALKEIGKAGITDEVLQKTRDLLQHETPTNLEHDLAIAPLWIRKLINKL